MKQLLVTTAMLVASASIAAAEVTLSGSARMGVISNFDDANTIVDESNLAFTSRARVQFNLSGESDSGLSFGASFRADNAVGANSGDAGSVFISGGFGKLSMGDVDGAAQMATGHVAGVGLTGLGDLNESTFIGAGDGESDPTALYEYAVGDFAVYLSIANPVQTRAVFVTTSGGSVDDVLDRNAMAVGAKYTFGDYSVGFGYEKLTGKYSAVGGEQFNIDHLVLKVSGKIAGFDVQGLFGQADGEVLGQATGNMKQYAASVSYTTGALTGTVFYTDDSSLKNGMLLLSGSNAGQTVAYGIGGSYDLGGGASVVGGLVKDHDEDSEAFDIGLNFTF